MDQVCLAQADHAGVPVSCAACAFGAHAECLDGVELHLMQRVDAPTPSWITLSRKWPVPRVCWG
ncbi:hypothetical protein GCM10015535_30580 [Streptomyces gelaticus]|uniref:Uncharacterized protein n=1 Tax=Streptomyces gelaticus TaxID=285446 RepID=A0ABQ2W1L8_9ACTN|nr:hypothetical protein GCM10015535_30580 [Streptomyces gelaticus]